MLRSDVFASAVYTDAVVNLRCHGDDNDADGAAVDDCYCQRQERKGQQSAKRYSTCCKGAVHLFDTLVGQSIYDLRDLNCRLGIHPNVAHS